MQTQIIHSTVAPPPLERLISSIHIDYRGLPLAAVLNLPLNAAGLVLFAHASSEGHLSARNHYLTQAFTQRGIAVLQVSLFTLREENENRLSKRLQNDAATMANRVVAARQWISQQGYLQHLCLGCFGFGPAGTAVLAASGLLNHAVSAVVVCDAHPILPPTKLACVQAPTLLIADEANRQLDELAFRQLRCEKSIEVIPPTVLRGTSEALETLAEAAYSWFKQHFAYAMALKSAGLDR